MINNEKLLARIRDYGIKLMDLLKEGESETVEFKPSLSQMDKITESISAFSNTKGGTVLIGVSDKGEVLKNLERKLNSFLRTIDGMT
jgi:predicted HTH transcriptional regulator